MITNISYCFPCLFLRMRSETFFSQNTQNIYCSSRIISAWNHNSALGTFKCSTRLNTFEFHFSVEFAPVSLSREMRSINNVSQACFLHFLLCELYFISIAGFHAGALLLSWMKVLWVGVNSDLWGVRKSLLETWTEDFECTKTHEKSWKKLERKFLYSKGFACIL